MRYGNPDTCATRTRARCAPTPTHDPMASSFFLNGRALIERKLAPLLAGQARPQLCLFLFHGTRFPLLKSRPGGEPCPNIRSALQRKRPLSMGDRSGTLIHTLFTADSQPFVEDSKDSRGSTPWFHATTNDTLIAPPCESGMLFTVSGGLSVIYWYRST